MGVENLRLSFDLSFYLNAANWPEKHVEIEQNIPNRLIATHSSVFLLELGGCRKAIGKTLVK